MLYPGLIEVELVSPLSRAVWTCLNTPIELQRALNQPGRARSERVGSARFHSSTFEYIRPAGCIADFWINRLPYRVNSHELSTQPLSLHMKQHQIIVIFLQNCKAGGEATEFGDQENSYEIKI